jgi:acetyltransferase-like isoleucine patch superfamily enzyme
MRLFVYSELKINKMLRIGTSLRYPLLNGIYLPFKIYIKSFITIRNNAKLHLSGRLTIGNPNRSSATVSVAPASIYLGYNSTTKFGKSISMGPGVNIIVKDNASLAIGEGTYFTSDMHLEVVKKVEIGNDCAISWGVTIIDDNHHQLINEDGKVDSDSSEVEIGNHVWIGCNVTILKGTQIGNNCVVGAGSIVKGIFPHNSLIAGNPARVIKTINGWK